MDRNRKISHFSYIHKQEKKIIRINYTTLRMGLDFPTCRSKVIDYNIKIRKFLDSTKENFFKSKEKKKQDPITCAVIKSFYELNV